MSSTPPKPSSSPADISSSPTPASPPMGSPPTAPRGASTPASPPSATATAPAAPAAPGAAAIRTAPATEPHPNPQVAELQSMFPNIDAGVIEMVLESVNNDQDRAVESLLAMNDPEFKPEQPSPTQQRQVNDAQNQLQLDEEFARALQLQDQEDYRQQQAHRTAASQSPPPPPAYGAGLSGAFGGLFNRRNEQPQSQSSSVPDVLPYQPRVRRPRTQAQAMAQDPYARTSNEYGLEQRYNDSYNREGQGHAAQGDQQPAGMIAFEDKLNQFAETGRQTFNTFLTRAKAKYNEFQEQQAANRAQAQEEAYVREQQQYEYQAPPVSQSPGRRSSGGTWGGDGQSGNRYMSPGQRTTSLSSATSGNSDAQPVAASRRWHPSDTFDDPAPASRATGGANVIHIAGRRSPAATGTSPDKGAAGKIDLAKLGFLPKKRVNLHAAAAGAAAGGAAGVAAGVGAASLMDDNDPNPDIPSTPSNHATGASLVDQIPKTPTEEFNPHQLGDDDDDEDDDLEYTKNPFDEK